MSTLTSTWLETVYFIYLRQPKHYPAHNSLKYKVIFHTISPQRHIYQKCIWTAKKLKRNDANKSKLNTFLIMPRRRERGRDNPSQKASQAEKQFRNNTWHARTCVCVCVRVLLPVYLLYLHLLHTWHVFFSSSVGICKLCWLGVMLYSGNSANFMRCCHLCPKNIYTIHWGVS